MEKKLLIASLLNEQFSNNISGPKFITHVWDILNRFFTSIYFISYVLLYLCCKFNNKVKFVLLFMNIWYRIPPGHWPMARRNVVMAKKATDHQISADFALFMEIPTHEIGHKSQILPQVIRNWSEIHHLDIAVYDFQPLQRNPITILQCNQIQQRLAKTLPVWRHKRYSQPTPSNFYTPRIPHAVFTQCPFIHFSDSLRFTLFYLAHFWKHRWNIKAHAFPWCNFHVTFDLWSVLVGRSWKIAPVIAECI